MNKQVLLFLFLGIVLPSAAQSVDCKKWKNGNFAMYFDQGIKYSIVRKGSKQIENNSKTGFTAELKVKWINPCTYELRRKKIIYNPSNEPDIPGLVITVKILESFEDYCLIQVKSNRSGDVGYKDFFYIDNAK